MVGTRQATLRIWPVLAGLIGLAMAGTAAQAQSEIKCEGTTCVKTVTVKPGGTVTLAPGINSIRSASDCTFVEPKIETVVKPRFGRIAPKIVAYTIPTTAPGGAPTGVCAGKTTKGLQINYIAAPTAKGSDEVVLRVQTKVGAAVNTMTAKYVINIE